MFVAKKAEQFSTKTGNCENSTSRQKTMSTVCLQVVSTMVSTLQDGILHSQQILLFRLFIQQKVNVWKSMTLKAMSMPVWYNRQFYTSILSYKSSWDFQTDSLLIGTKFFFNLYMKQFLCYLYHRIGYV